MVGEILKVNKAQFNNSIRQPTSNINLSLLYVVWALRITFSKTNKMASKETVQIVIKLISTIYAKTPVDARSALIGMFCGPILYNSGNYLLKSNSTTRVGYIGSTICLYLLGPRVALYITPYVVPVIKMSAPVIGRALIFVGNKLLVPVAKPLV